MFTLSINSNEFARIVSKLIETFENEQSFENEDDNQKVEDLMKRIKLYTGLKELKTSFNYKKSGKIILNSERNKKFVCLKETIKEDDYEIKFFVEQGNEDSCDYYFYLAETILDNLKIKLSHLKSLQGDAKIERRVVFLLTRLLKCQSPEQYESVISDYKSFRFLNI